MKWCIETFCGEVIEVTSLYDKKGEDTDELWRAEACVIKPTKDVLQSFLIEDRAVHRVQ